MRVYQEVVNLRDDIRNNIAFCEANGLVAENIAAHDLRVGLFTIEYRERVRDETGRMLLDPDEPNALLTTPWRRTRLKSRPGNHGLKTKWVVR